MRSVMANQYPNPNVIFPIPHVKTVVYVKSVVKNKNIIVGDFTYFSDEEAPEDFERHVTHHYDFYGDKLIIGKFCAIAKHIEFIMNGANHQMNAISTYPFYIFEGWNEAVPALEQMPLKGDTIVGNDVWIGQNVTILPGVHIGDGAIIGANSVVGHHIEPYSIAVGNPTKCIRKRFDEELIQLLLEIQWWNWPIEQINRAIPLLTMTDLDQAKHELRNFADVC